MAPTELGYLCIAWIALMAVAIRASMSQKGAGLVLSYVLNLSLIHLAGALVFLVPWYGDWTAYLVVSGFTESVYALACFLFGALFVAGFVRKFFWQKLAPPQRIAEPQVARIYLVIGFSCYFALTTVLGSVASLNSVLAAGWNLSLVGIVLLCWRAWTKRRYKELALYLAAGLSLPLFTIITQGFLGFGTAVFLTIAAFVTTFYRPRYQLVLAGIVFAYLGASFFVTYMRDRAEIRQTVWGGESYGKRGEKLAESIKNFEWFSLSNREHLARVDSRLNQNLLVGSAVQYISSGGNSFAHGRTVSDALTSLIPRAIWPDKPVFAGSGQIVSEYTGIMWDQNTSVGVGQVMEFYINFGRIGVVIGALLMGTVVGLFDLRAGEYLRAGDWFSFTKWYLPGVAFLQVGGVLAEISAGAAAAAITAVAANAIVRRRLSKSTQVRRKPNQEPRVGEPRASIT